MNPEKAALLEALTAEQFNGGGWATPPRSWNGGTSTAHLTHNDDDVVRARRRRELLEAAADVVVEESA